MSHRCSPAPEGTQQTEEAEQAGLCGQGVLFPRHSEHTNASIHSSLPEATESPALRPTNSSLSSLPLRERCSLHPPALLKHSKPILYITEDSQGRNLEAATKARTMEAYCLSPDSCSACFHI